MHSVAALFFMVAQVALGLTFPKQLDRQLTLRALGSSVPPLPSHACASEEDAHRVEQNVGRGRRPRRLQRVERVELPRVEQHQ